MMRRTKRHVVVLVTVPKLAIARKLARAVLSEHLAACVNILPGVESHYWWQGKLEHGKELLLVIKTTRKRLAPMAAVVKALHPYDTPEIVVLPLKAGSARYLDWLDASVEGEAG
jgi:periplasmic divalent cation tolerance protein